MAAGDFNGDGRADAVAANEAADTVSVLLDVTLDEGNPTDGVPAFGVAVPFAVGTGPTAVAVGDFDGDGRDDIAVVNRQANSVSVLRNVTPVGAATPTFAANQDFATGALPTAIAVGDFNGDGRMDIANGGDGFASVLENTTVPGAATPTFAPKQDTSVGSGPRGLVAADFDRDGRTDLAVSSFTVGDNVSVLRNTSAGAGISFAVQRFAVGGHPPYRCRWATSTATA